MRIALVVAALVIMPACSNKPRSGEQPAAADSIVSLWSNPAKADGKQVTLQGTVRPIEVTRAAGGSFTTGGPVCTELDCDDANPCCNTCASPATLVESNDLPLGVTLIGEGYGCSGDTCQMTCKPEMGKTYTVSGTLRTRHTGMGVELQLQVAELR